MTLRGGNSIECYTFHEDGRVELRHGGVPTVNDVGAYSPDSGTVAWQSQRTSTVELNPGGVAIDGLPVSAIQTCTP